MGHAPIQALLAYGDDTIKMTPPLQWALNISTCHRASANPDDTNDTNLKGKFRRTHKHTKQTTTKHHGLSER